MSSFKSLPAILVLGAMPFATSAQESQNINQVLDKVVARERAEMVAIR